MSKSSFRLALAIEAGAVSLPEGRVVVIGPPAGYDLSGISGDVVVLHWSRPDWEAFEARGVALEKWPGERRAAAAVVILPRARDLSRALLARACALSDGPVIIDGAKTDGVDSIYRELRKRVQVGAAWSKAHGKVFEIAPAQDLADWSETETTIAGGWVTRPGVFSADAVDRASEMLASALPPRLAGDVADLGAGWGYLSARALGGCAGITRLHLVEADARALDCARVNVTDPRAAFHWADALSWAPPARLDAVIMNPPFHAGRAADPALGRSFLEAAARNLLPSGEVYLVANRHLPYEQALERLFAEHAEIGGDAGFKILHARRPRRKRRES